MSRKFVTIFFALLALALSACERSASTPMPTPTVEVNFPAVPTTSMNVVEQAGTQTAIAQTGTPQGGQEAAATAGTPAAIPSFTPLAGVQQTPIVVITPTAQGAASLPSVTPGAVTVVAPAAPVAVGGTYALQPGEFPYCIARRYNVNPDELLALNGLGDGGYYMPGLVLRLPSTGHAFPGVRALLAHPATYTVQLNDTIYSVACKFGDVDPVSLAAANSLPAPYTLTVGAQINIP